MHEKASHKCTNFFSTFQYMNANSVTRALGALEKLADAGVDVKSETGASGSMTNESTRKAQSLRRKSIANAVLKVSMSRVPEL